MSSTLPFSICLTTRDPRRKAFLTEAVRSCVAQDFPSTDFEIVIASAYPLTRASLPPSSVPVTVVESTGAWQGGRILDAARAAHGAHLVLMDDDDAFERGKLAHVARVLQANPDLLYLHHECRFVDAEGRPLVTTTFHRGTVRFKGPGYFGVKDEGQKQAEAGRMVRGFAFFNPSSIVVDPRLVLDGADLLAKVPSAPDLALFYLALARAGPVVLDPEKLTRYRVHGGNESIVAWPDVSLDFRIHVVETLNLVRARCGPSLPATTRRVLDAMILSGDFGIALLKGPDNQEEVGKAMVRLLRAPNALDPVTRFGAVPIGLAYMLSPSLTQWWLRSVRLRDLVAS